MGVRGPRSACDPEWVKEESGYEGVTETQERQGDMKED